MKRIGVFGGRDYPHRDRVWDDLDALLRKHGPFVVVVGGCNCREDEDDIGADYFADFWARAVRVASAGAMLGMTVGRPLWRRVMTPPVEEDWAFFPLPDIHWADWDRLKKAAGPIRNRTMARSGLDGAIQYPGNRGTASMRRECDLAGVPVWERT